MQENISNYLKKNVYQVKQVKHVIRLKAEFKKLNLSEKI